MADPLTSAAELLPLVFKEGRRRLVALSAIFAVVAIGALAVGLLLPKQYEAQTLLLVESRNAIAPLMGGRAVPTGGSEDAQIVRQAFLSRRILREVLASGGFGEVTSPADEIRMLSRIASRVSIQSPRRELVRIGYRDTDRQRCLAVTNKLAELYIRESTTGKGRQSRDAYEFIDRQVKEYSTKVEDAHAKVLAYTRELERRGGTAARALGARRGGTRLTPEQVAALSVEESTLAAELTASDARTGRTRRDERTAQLERELENLRTSLTENHPNVKRAREELRLQRVEADRASAAEDAETASVRARLEQVRRQLASAGQLATAGAGALAPETQAAPELRGVGQDSKLSELVRRYDAERAVYQDLLERRENARVSMELEAAHGGDSVRIYEPAELPVIASGLRIMHFALIGLVLGVAAPLGLLVLLLRLDPRVRSIRQLEQASAVPLLVGIPYAPTARDRVRQRRDVLLAAALVLSVFATYAGAFFVRNLAS